VHESIYEQLIPRLKAAYDGLPIGDPLADGVLVGPLIDADAMEGMERGLETAKADGGAVHGGGRTLADRFPDAVDVKSAIV
jgi:aldehyde dehydrogenase (NAD+)